jgi:hypothetical protein
LRERIHWSLTVGRGVCIAILVPLSLRWSLFAGHGDRINVNNGNSLSRISGRHVGRHDQLAMRSGKVKLGGFAPARYDQTSCGDALTG